MEEEDKSRPDLIEGLPVKRLLESFGAGGRHDPPPEPEGGWQGRLLGSYELIEEIDRGGMGIVFRARQASLARDVAIKVLRSANFAGEDELARFQGEAHILGKLNHPNIVPIFDVGEDEGQPFIAMKWIEGGTLLELVDRCIDDPALAATLMIKVGSAIDEAHRRGVLHRDLKPANILVDQSDEPHVTDFGLSRHLDDESDLTRSRAIVGSPNYLAPEQISKGVEGVTTAVDVFGLGAILYHLLTGRPPFEGDSALGVLKKVEEADPARPSSLNPKVDRDLETICLKCLHREPSRRYHSADALVDDLQRWKRGDAITARLRTRSERLANWSRRHPVRSLLLAASLVMIAAGIALNAYYQIGLRESRDRALDSQREARRANDELEATVIRLELERAEQELFAGRQRVGIQQLLEVLEQDPNNQVASERLLHEWERRRFPIEAQQAMEVEGSGKLLAYSADGERVAALTGRSLTVWDVTDGSPLLETKPTRENPRALELNSDGSILAMATVSGVRAWDVATGAIVFEWLAPEEDLADAAISPDGSRLFVGHGTEVAIFDLKSQREIQTLQLERRIRGRLCLSPSGELLVIAHTQGLSWWDVPSSEQITMSESFNPSMLAFSGDGRRLIIARMDDHQIWDAIEKVPLNDPVKHRSMAFGVDLDATGERYAIAFVAGKTEIFDTISGSRRCEPIIAQGQIQSARFRPHSNLLGTISSGGMIRHWDLDSEIGASTEQSEYVSTMTAFDRQRGLRVQRDLTFLGHLSSREERRQIPIDGSFWHASLSPSGQEIAVVTNQDRRARVRILDSTSLAVLDTITESPGLKFVRYSPDGNHLLVTQDNGGMILWDVANRAIRMEVPDFPGTRKVAFSADGKSVVASGYDGKVTRWSLESGERMAELCNHGGYADGVAISEDGTMLLTGGLNRKAYWWKLGASGTGEAELIGEANFHGAVNWVKFSPAGEKYVMAASRDGSVRVWETEGMNQLCEISAHDLPLNHASFTLDGEHLITISMDASVRVWHAATGHPVTSPLRHDDWWEVPKVELPLAPAFLDEIRSHCEVLR